MGSVNSSNAIKSESDDMMSTPGRSDCAQKTLPEGLDPRSPVTEFHRTPIQVQGTPEQVTDPRSPTCEVMRTPIYGMKNNTTDNHTKVAVKLDLSAADTVDASVMTLASADDIHCSMLGSASSPMDCVAQLNPALSGLSIDAEDKQTSESIEYLERSMDTDMSVLSTEADDCVILPCSKPKEAEAAIVSASYIKHRKPTSTQQQSPSLHRQHEVSMSSPARSPLKVINVGKQKSSNISVKDNDSPRVLVQKMQKFNVRKNKMKATVKSSKTKAVEYVVLSDDKENA